MQGANEYARLFKSGQHGRLYLVSGSHARGITFHIYVLPEGVEVKTNFGQAPLNCDAVEVYGIVSGQAGWTESYGWLHHGKWQEDFYALVDKAKADEAERKALEDQRIANEKAESQAKVNKLLSSY